MLSDFPYLAFQIFLGVFSALTLHTFVQDLMYGGGGDEDKPDGLT